MEALRDPASRPSEDPGSAPELFVVLNPGSGAEGADVKRATLEAVFREAGRPFRFVSFESTAELPRACAAPPRALASAALPWWRWAATAP